MALIRISLITNNGEYLLHAYWPFEYFLLWGAGSSLFLLFSWVVFFLLTCRHSLYILNESIGNMHHRHLICHAFYLSIIYIPWNATILSTIQSVYQDTEHFHHLESSLVPLSSDYPPPHKSSHSSDFYDHKLVLPILEFYINDFLRYILFVFSFSLSTFLRFIHLFASISIHSFHCWVVFHGRLYLVIHSHVDGHLDCFQFLVIMNKAARTFLYKAFYGYGIHLLKICFFLIVLHFQCEYCSLGNPDIWMPGFVQKINDLFPKINFWKKNSH